MAKLLSERVVIVTGATGGIGTAVALQCAAAGAKLLLTGRRQSDGDALVDRIVNAGAQAHFVSVDLTAQGAAEQIVQMAVDRFGRLDVLVNNAGILRTGTALTCTDEDWDAVIATNVTAVFRASRAAVRQMHAHGTGGAIVNIASDWGLVGARDALAYAASKGAVIQMTRSMALDHAAAGIRVNAVCPGDTDTAMLGAGVADRAAHIEVLGAALPLGRIVAPDDVAHAVVFLASDAARSITGVALPVDAGNTAQ